MRYHIAECLLIYVRLDVDLQYSSVQTSVVLYVDNVYQLRNRRKENFTVQRAL